MATHSNIPVWEIPWAEEPDRLLSMKLQRVTYNLAFCYCCSVTKSCLTLRSYELQHARLPCLSLSPSLLRLMSIESVMPSNHLILCHPLLILPSIFPSIRVFSNESIICIRWPKVLKFQLQHQSFQRIFRTDFL